MEQIKGNRVVVSVVGNDKKGIIANVTTKLAENQVNVLDISQTIMQEFFTMVMVVDITDYAGDIESLSAQFHTLEEQLEVKIRFQH